MTQASVKLLSAWVGPKPPWFADFQSQMHRFQSVDWELVPPPSIPADLPTQILWFNKLGTSTLGLTCGKGSHPEGICDFRPAYGEMFADRYAGYTWWGWLDLDMFLGDLDGLLPGLLRDDRDVVTFKERHLSGCLTLLRNEPRLTGLFRLSEVYLSILGDERYHVWDESGYFYYPGDNFYQLMLKHGVRVAHYPELYHYDSPPPDKPRPIDFRDGKVFDRETSREVLFHHFTSNIWPIAN